MIATIQRLYNTIKVNPHFHKIHKLYNHFNCLCIENNMFLEN